MRNKPGDRLDHDRLIIGARHESGLGLVLRLAAFSPAARNAERPKVNENLALYYTRLRYGGRRREAGCACADRRA